MAAPKFEEQPMLGNELLVGISVLTADALRRSGLLQLVLAGELEYSTVEFNRLHTPYEEISLMLSTDDEGNHIITMSENPLALDTDEQVFDLGPMTCLILHKDGKGLAPRDTRSNQDVPLSMAAEHIITSLPDFTGAAASIEVLVQEE